MSIIDKLAKRFGYERKTGKRSFHAAASNRLTADWSTGSGSLDTQLRYSLESLRERSRELIQNNPYANKFMSMLKSNVLGAGGLKLKNRAQDPPTFRGGEWVPGLVDEYANRLIEDAWKEWGKRQYCTVDKRLSWAEVQHLSLETCGTDGEALVRLFPGFPNKFGFAVQLVDPDLLDTKRNEVLPNGNEVRMGVELSAQGEPVAYWMHTRNPNDRINPSASREWERVPAINIVHPYQMRRITQTRGFPWLASVMLNMQMLGGYEEAELVASRTAASKMAFIKTRGDQQYTGADDGTGPQMEAEPGSIEQLPAGMELDVLDWRHPNTDFGGFVKSMLRSISAGVNVSYNNLANDLEGVNFSSGRMGQMEEREHWRSLQGWFGDVFCAPIFKQWLFSQLMSGNIPLPMSRFEKFNAPQWHGRRWAWVDPQKEVNAIEMELRNNLTSYTRVLAERNIDRDELFAEIAADKAAMEQAGLTAEDIMGAATDESDED